MSAYLQKAHNNVDTAELLVANGFLMSSAHPAYYSAFLAVKYVLAHFKSIDYATQDKKAKGKDSHNSLSGLALPFMAKADATTQTDYLVWYNKLKKMRKQADYTPDVIADALLMENLNLAKNFIKRVDLYFKVA